MEAPKAARIEQIHKYPTRYTKKATTNFTDASGSRKQYTAATHLESAIKSDNIFTMMAIEEIAESINALQDNNINVKDPTSEDLNVHIVLDGKRQRMMNYYHFNNVR